MMSLRTAAALAWTLTAVSAPWSPCTAQTVTRGPYLQTGTQTSIVIRWRTDLPTDSRVRYGTEIGSLINSVQDPTLTTEHVMTVSGLDPETRYYYAIGTIASTLAGDDGVHYFRTSPPVGATRPVRVWVIGDSGLANLSAARVRNGYRNYPGSGATDVWLMLGDNAYNLGTDAEYQAAVFDMYPTLLRNTMLWPTRGNHDQIHAGSNNDYYDIFSLPIAGEAGGLSSGTEAYYSFDFSNMHFVCLDSQGSDLGTNAPMLTWLVQDLAATAQDWIVAYWHHPPYSKGSHDSDAELQLITMRQNALPILEAGGVDLVLTGHSHSYERSFLLDSHYGLSSTLADSMKIDDGDGRPGGDGAYHKPTLGPGSNEGAVYAVAGSSSQTSGGPLNHPVMITSQNRLGSLVLDVSSNVLAGTFIDTTGVAHDSFTIIKGTPPSGVRHPPAANLWLSSRPNPFSADTQLDYAVPAPGRVELSVYDVRGHLVRNLLDRHEAAGANTVKWDGRDNGGRVVAQGVYFAVLKVSGQKGTHRLVVLR